MMDSTLIAGIVGAVATIAAPLIVIWVTRRRQPAGSNSPPERPQNQQAPTTEETTDREELRAEKGSEAGTLVGPLTINVPYTSAYPVDFEVPLDQGGPA